MLENGWPLILLALRVAVVVALYLFVITAIRALRAEVRARTTPLAVPPVVLATQPASQIDRAVAAPYTREIDEAAPPRRSRVAEANERASAIARDDDTWRPIPDPTRTASPSFRRSSIGWRTAVPIYATLVLVLAGAAVFALRAPARAPSGATKPSASQLLPTPAAGHVTVVLAATEDTTVRVTVDGVVQFDGTLRAGQRQNWDGSSLIDVWTDKGKTLGLAVNGHDLGPYSPAMGHPDWNRIDFSFWPGWTQQQISG